MKRWRDKEIVCIISACPFFMQAFAIGYSPRLLLLIISNNLWHWLTAKSAVSWRNGENHRNEKKMHTNHCDVVVHSIGEILVVVRNALIGQKHRLPHFRHRLKICSETIFFSHSPAFISIFTYSRRVDLGKVRFTSKSTVLLGRC